MKIRHSAGWMIQADDRILELVAAEGWSSPSLMDSCEEIRVGRGTITDRVRMLLSAALLAPVAGDMVELTTWGELYLDGEIDAEHQPRPTPRNLAPINPKESGTTV